MPKTTIWIYRNSDGSVPLLAWLDEQPEKVQDKFTALIELLSHGCTKASQVPEGEIRQAVENLARYKSNPAEHRYETGL